MGIDFNLYRNNFTNTFKADVGAFGQLCVEERLAKLGWKLAKTRKAGNELSSLYDYDAFYTNSSGKKTHRLIEVKTKKSFDYAFGKYSCLHLDQVTCDNYDNIIEKLHTPMDLFWLDFRNKKIYMKDYKTLLIRTEIRGKMFPFYEDKFDNVPPGLFFASDQFDCIGNIAFDEYKHFVKICDKYGVEP